MTARPRPARPPADQPSHPAQPPADQPSRSPSPATTTRLPALATRTDRTARVITEVFSPGILVAALLLAVAGHAADTLAQALLWGLIAAAAASFVPVLAIVRGVRRGRLSDRHVTVHSQRRGPMVVILASTAAGTAGLALAGAPRELLALIAAMLAALLVAVPVTVLARWGISFHALVAAGSAAALTVVFGPALALTWPVAAAVAWARVRLREHTPAQVLAGAAVGAGATGVLFPLLL